MICSITVYFIISSNAFDDIVKCIWWYHQMHHTCPLNTTSMIKSNNNGVIIYLCLTSWKSFGFTSHGLFALNVFLVLFLCNQVLISIYIDLRTHIYIVYILTTSKIILKWVSTCDSMNQGNVIVLPHWQTRPLAPWLDFPLSHITLSWYWVNQSFPYPSKYQVPGYVVTRINWVSYWFGKKS